MDRWRLLYLAWRIEFSKKVDKIQFFLNILWYHGGMAEQVNSKYPERARFLNGEQKKFLELVRSKLNTDSNGLAKIVGVSSRTIRDWKREKLTISLPALEKFCLMAKVGRPDNIEIIKPFQLAALKARNGWEAVIKKYGHMPRNEEHRKRKWFEWWENEGKLSRPLLEINKPKHSEKLAEFAGLMLGDGGITQHQVSITLNRFVDYKYADFVEQLVFELFKVKPRKFIPRGTKVFRIYISRSELVSFCKSIGLVVGHKIRQKIDVPEWIKNNRKYFIACIRGLIDTDGCIFIHRYKVNGKWYSYKKLVFTSFSEPLRNSVFSFLQSIGITPRMAAGRDVRIDSTTSIKKYFELVGTSNPKHLKKYQSVL